MLDNNCLIDENSTFQHSEQELEANLDDKMMQTMAKIQEHKFKLREPLRKSNENNSLLESDRRSKHPKLENLPQYEEKTRSRTC